MGTFKSIVKGVLAIAVFCSFSTQVIAQEAAEQKTPTVDVAGKKITLTACTIEGHKFEGTSAMSLFKAIEAANGRIYIANDTENLYGFKLDESTGCKLTLDPAFGEKGVLKLPKKVKYLTSDQSGRVIASNGIFDAYLIQDGKNTGTCAKHYVELDASGTWGFHHWVNADPKLLTISDNTCSSADWVLKDLSKDETRKGDFKNINTAKIIGGNIYIGGVGAKKVNDREPRFVQVYTKAGQVKFKFGNMEKSGQDDSFGWVHGIESCGAGVCVLDSNYRKITFWSADGKFQGLIKFNKDTGFNYPWMNDLTRASSGKVYVLVADKDKDKNVVGSIYQLAGF